MRPSRLRSARSRSSRAGNRRGPGRVVRDMTHDKPELFYILDARTVVGNCSTFWAPDGQGYVCDLAKAGLYRRDQLPTGRDTDIPVPADVAKSLAVTHVRIEALRGAGLLDALDKARAEEHRQSELEELELDDDANDAIRDIVERLAEARLRCLR